MPGEDLGVDPSQRCAEARKNELYKSDSSVCSQPRNATSQLHQKRGGQQVKGGDSAPQFCFCEIPPEMVHPSGVPSTRKTGTCWSSPEEVTKTIKEVQNFSYEDRLRDSEVVQLGQQKALGGRCCSLLEPEEVPKEGL